MITTGLQKSQPKPFSRRWWLSAARNLAWVVVVTVLVWVYADMRFTDRRTVQVTVRVTTKAGGAITLLKGQTPVEAIDKPIQVELEGSRETLDRVQGQFAEPVEWDAAAAGLGVGEHPVDTRDIIASQIARSGLRIISAGPSSIAVRIGRLVRQSVPVQVSVTGAELARDPKVPPMGITITAQQWEQITQANPSPVLKTNEVNLANMEPGKVISVEFEVFPEIDGVPVKLDDSSVTVPIEIMRRTVKKSFKVTIRTLVASDWADMASYKLVKRDALEWRPEIVVSGSQTDLDKLEAKDIDAYVVITEDDKRPMETWTTRAVTIRFPPSLRVELPGDPPQVGFRLDKLPDTPTMMP